MAVQRRDIWIWTCDAPGCEYTKNANGQDFSEGFSGTVSTSGPRYKNPFFACTQEHIEPAIVWVATHFSS